MKSKGWLKVGYAPQQVVTLNFPDDSVEALFQPSSGDGWHIDGQGKQNVGFQPVYTVYIIFSEQLQTL